MTTALQALLDAVLDRKGVVFSLVTIAVLWLASRLSLRAAKRYLSSRAQKQENVLNFLFVLRYVWLAVIVIFTVVSFSGSLAALGLSAAFLGMVMGWSLQAPVTGMAAWLMILLKRPFRIGDRVIISGITGDVTDITLTHVVLNQVGGTIGGEEKSGRGVLIPNAILFQQTIHNYTSESEYLLDEVPVLITYDSDLDEAERILIECARTVTEKIVRATGESPFIRAEFFESGVRVRVRYKTPATERQRITSEIVRRILVRFRESDSVSFCYPHVQVVYRGPRTPGESQGGYPAC